MNQTANNFALAGLGAGAVSGLAAVFASVSGPLGGFVIFFAAVPVIAAGMGWGNLAAAVAAVVSAFIIAIFVGPLFALYMGIASLVPAGWTAYLSNLGRPAAEIGGPDDAIAWYPLSDILVQIALLTVVAAFTFGLAIGYGTELISRFTGLFIEAVQAQNPAYNPAAIDRQGIEGFMVLAVPAITGATGVILLFAAWYTASRAVQALGRTRRPADDIPAVLRMPRTGLIGLMAGLALTFASGPLAWTGWLITGAFSGGFLLAGGAILHLKTRGVPSRMLLLVAVWLAAIVLTIPLIVLFFIGLLSTARTATVSKGGPGNSTT